MCDCITTIEEKLKPNGQSLSVAFMLRGGSLVVRPYVNLFRRDKGVIENRRGMPKSMIASFCPFCGTRYPDDEDESALAAPSSAGGQNG